jgi:mono/diheme cytochrome c family protein
VLLAGAGDSIADAAQMQGDAARGRTLFVSKGCVVCHAINEVGGTSAPPLDPEAALATSMGSTLSPACGGAPRP